jgi:hypothetical protein
MQNPKEYLQTLQEYLQDPQKYPQDQQEYPQEFREIANPKKMNFKFEIHANMKDI